jgi:hypothetical protein
MSAELPKVQQVAEQQQPANSKALYRAKELMCRSTTLGERWLELAKCFRQRVSNQLVKAASWTAQQQQLHQQCLARPEPKAVAQEQLYRELLASLQEQPRLVGMLSCSNIYYCVFSCIFVFIFPLQYEGVQ